MERVISGPRMDSYRMNGESPEVAFCKYLWNAKLCESLYPSLQFLEVAYRNAVHSEIAKEYGSEWLLNRHHLLVGDREREKIKEAEGNLVTRGKAVTEAYLVSELGFGFWTSLLDKRYYLVWHRIISGVFPHMPKAIRKREEISPPINRIRKLRNAALHHHSIWHWGDLREHHDDIHTVLEYICASTSLMAKRVDRFKTIHSGGHTQFLPVIANLPN